jgi:hypothetical protein
MTTTLSLKDAILNRDNALTALRRYEDRQDITEDDEFATIKRWKEVDLKIAEDELYKARCDAFEDAYEAEQDAHHALCFPAYDPYEWDRE